MISSATLYMYLMFPFVSRKSNLEFNESLSSVTQFENSTVITPVCPKLPVSESTPRWILNNISIKLSAVFIKYNVTKATF